MIYLLLALVSGGPLGLGDVRLAALLGLLLGASGTATAVLGALLPYLLAAPVTAGRVLLRRVGRHDRIAFGPFLIVGAVLAAAETGGGP